MSNRQPISTFLGIAATVVLVTNGSADIIIVGPGDSIQAAIDAAVDGDEIVVAPGTYFETINFLGKAIIVRSTEPTDPTTVASTIIDGTGFNHVVLCQLGEGANTVLNGLVITGGNANGVNFPDDVGGGMRNFNNASPTVMNCVFAGNSASNGGGMFNNTGSNPTVTNCSFIGNTAINGGGMYNDNSSPTVTNCSFIGNTAFSGGGMSNFFGSSPTVTNCTFSGNLAGLGVGGGMLNHNSSPTVTNCSFIGNTAATFSGGCASPGGGMYNEGASPTVTNCTFTGNTACPGGGMFNDVGSSPTVTNCILWNNLDEIFGPATVAYSDVQGGFPGPGNIDADPLFVDLVSGDLHLSPRSPCIDAGVNTALPLEITTDLDGNPRFVDEPCIPDTGIGDPPIVDMGAYEWQLDILIDCNDNRIQDTCDILDDPSLDCDGNLLIDACEILADPSLDCDENGLIDACEILADPSLDCDENGLIDACEILADPSLDCDENGLIDACEILADLDCGTTIFVDDDNCPGPGSGTQADPYCSIQTAIDNAVDHDEIVVAPGTYFETINFLGKWITVRSTDPLDPAVVAATIIDGTGSFHVVQCVSGEGPGTVLDGFVITGGNANDEFAFPNHSGGGMLNLGTSPTVTNCTFTGNTAGSGGGMYNAGSSPTVLNCTFSGNTAGPGGGMYNAGSSPTVANCTFNGNTANTAGGGMYNFGSSSNPTVTNCTFSGNGARNGGGMNNAFSSPTVTNCTFTANTASNLVVGGGGMFNIGSSPTVTNCILWNNSPDQFSRSFGSPVVAYSVVQGSFPGTGNIDADPLFVDPLNGNYRLSSGSPCIDAADSNAVPGGVTSDLDGNPRFVDHPATADTGNGVCPVDMGAYEFQEGTVVCCSGDLNGDGVVNVLDLIELVMSFGPCEGCPADINGDGVVNVLDLIELVMSFGQCPGGECVWDLNGDGVVDQSDVQAVTSNLGPCEDPENCPEDVNGDGVVNGQDAAAVATHFGPCP